MVPRPSFPKPRRQLVDGSTQAAIAGDSARQFALLRQAVRIEPNDPVARWQLGQIQVDGRWMRSRKHSARLPPIRLKLVIASCGPNRRKPGGSTGPGALVSQKQSRRRSSVSLGQRAFSSTGNEEAHALLGYALAQRPTRIARRSSGIQGAVARAETGSKKVGAHVDEMAAGGCGRAMSPREKRHSQEIRALKDPDAIPAMEKADVGLDAGWESTAMSPANQPGVCRMRWRAMPAPAASVSLARHAVFSLAPDGSRSAAIADLKLVPTHEYVPLLLSGLAMPT